jgi:hypothetical protein
MSIGIVLFAEWQCYCSCVRVFCFFWLVSFPATFSSESPLGAPNGMADRALNLAEHAAMTQELSLVCVCPVRVKSIFISDDSLKDVT